MHHDDALRVPCCCLGLQVTDSEYDLVLQPDINTRGHTQWFFFAVSNTRAGRQYRLNIINLLKEDSLYNNGMLPLMHSDRQMRTKVGRQHTISSVPHSECAQLPEQDTVLTCGSAGRLAQHDKHLH